MEGVPLWLLHGKSDTQFHYDRHWWEPVFTAWSKWTSFQSPGLAVSTVTSHLPEEHLYGRCTVRWYFEQASLTLEHWLFTQQLEVLLVIKTHILPVVAYDRTRSSGPMCLEGHRLMTGETIHGWP
jgi:hypothetical protein